MIVGKFYVHALLNLFGKFTLSVVYVIGGWLYNRNCSNKLVVRYIHTSVAKYNLRQRFFEDCIHKKYRPPWV